MSIRCIDVSDDDRMRAQRSGESVAARKPAEHEPDAGGMAIALGVIGIYGVVA